MKLEATLSIFKMIFKIILCLTITVSCQNTQKNMAIKKCNELILYSGWSYGHQSNVYQDMFASPQDEPDMHKPPSAWHTVYHPRNTLNYDEPANDNSLVQHFRWDQLGFGPITHATLEFCARPSSSNPAAADRDNLRIYPYNVAQVNPLAAAYLGTNTGQNQRILGLANQPWSSFYGSKNTFIIDLHNFPSDKWDRQHGGHIPNVLGYPLGGICYFDPVNSNNGGYQIAGGYDLTRLMNYYNWIDIFIGDNTEIDYMKLTLKSCNCDDKS